VPNEIVIRGGLPNTPVEALDSFKMKINPDQPYAQPTATTEPETPIERMAREAREKEAGAVCFVDKDGTVTVVDDVPKSSDDSNKPTARRWKIEL
jgi:hypothetical protein